MPLSCWFQGSSRIKDKCAMHFFFHFQDTVPSRTHGHGKSPKGKFMWNWWIWHRYGPVLPQPKVLRSLGTQTCPSFLWEFIFCLPKSPKSISTGMDLFLWYLWNLWYLLCFQVWKWLMISNFWTCTYNFDVFFFRKKVPKIRRPRSRSKNPRSVLEILVCALTLKDEGWPWELYYHHENINM